MSCFMCKVANINIFSSIIIFFRNLRGAIVELNSLCDKLRKQRNNLTNLSDTLQNNCEELDGLLADKNQELEVRRKVLEKNDRRKDR